ncbi:hypothetical protein J23TS9_20590 [Paenibacillus sp. J23TS9]|nr:hypothetical protein J23TS9_20590 [Paenibacillus sp. J23TS9]
MEKVTLEVSWLSLAHNMLKQATVEKKRKGAILLQRENRSFAEIFSAPKIKQGCLWRGKSTYETAPLPL